MVMIKHIGVVKHGTCNGNWLQEKIAASYLESQCVPESPTAG